MLYMFVVGIQYIGSISLLLSIAISLKMNSQLRYTDFGLFFIVFM